MHEINATFASSGFLKSEVAWRTERARASYGARGRRGLRRDRTRRTDLAG